MASDPSAAFNDLDPGGGVVFSPPVDEKEVDTLSKTIRDAVEEGLRLLENEGVEAYREKYHAVASDEAPPEEEGGLNDEEKAAALIKGSPRRYQSALFDRCKHANTIVHLGTGQGKTLIALLCMQHFFAGGWDGDKNGAGENSGAVDGTGCDRGNQIWFLVPSVALAVQHTVTIKANLGPNCLVGTACHTATTSKKSRDALAKANIIVATHGSAKDLLDHYSDDFNLERVQLLIIDECHYATGNHGYAQIMQSHYHRLEENLRPRIVGLTASPLINIKKSASPEILHNRMLELERCLNAKIVCFADLGQPSAECLEAVEKDVQEQAIEYDSATDSFPSLPDHGNIGLHKTRIKELNQILNLYKELGPQVTGQYCHTLAKEVSRSRFEGESSDEYDRLIEHLNDLSRFCSHQCELSAGDGARSSKLVRLESLVEKLLGGDKSCPSESVGLLFVERRITAIALHAYFKDRRRKDESIRPDCLVRQSNQVFKYLSFIHKMGNSTTADDSRAAEAIKKAEIDWLHQTKEIRSVLDGLRKRETNILIATSVVEEGVDVAACSFVIVFDGLKTTKAYVQMKGRARQKNAKFYCFLDTNPSTPPPPVSLKGAQEVEKAVTRFLGQREENSASIGNQSPVSASFRHTPASRSEEDAIRVGEFRTHLARVDTRSSKSLLNRYFLSIPMDSQARSSRATMVMQMPIYNENELILPAHLPPSVRVCSLPQPYWSEPKKRKEEMLALMAVVRLKELKLIGDRLLPLKRSDILQAMEVLPPLPPPTEQTRKYSSPTATDSSMTVYLYPLTQAGSIFDQHCAVLKGKGKCLGLLVRSPLPSVPPFSFDHAELGRVHCCIGSCQQPTFMRSDAANIGGKESYCEEEEIFFDCREEEANDLSENAETRTTKKLKSAPLHTDRKHGHTISISKLEWKTCADFYTALMNGRWRKRTGRKVFWYDDGETAGNTAVPPYVVVALTSDRNVDWDRMKKVISDYCRKEDERVAAVKTTKSKGQCGPRLIAPRYDPNVTYISFEPSALTCAAPFPNSDFASYSDYFEKRRSFRVDTDSKLLAVQHIWTLPRHVQKGRRGNYACTKSESEKPTTKKANTNDRESLQDGEIAPCANLRAALLAQDACMEAPVADAPLFLHCVLLPQILYLVDRHLTRAALISHCLEKYCILGKHLAQMDPENVIEALTAKSCALDGISYDRLEYLGDAVLKLIHVDALLHSPKLEKWISCLHEGDLSALRSEMGSNKRLNDAAVSAGIDQFILTSPLARGQWIPNGLQIKIDEKGEEPASAVSDVGCIKPSVKVCADVIEALIGLIYLKHGFEAAMEAAEELLISIPQQGSKPTLPGQSYPFSGGARFKRALKFLGQELFHDVQLLREATTHASAIDRDVPSYQKLEWIGDAVVCLFTREWLFKRYDSLCVASLVILESTMVCNETLSYLAWRSGLQLMINHADPSLPGRIENCALAVRPGELGLWATDAPKILADVVEALLGAAHVDGGVQAGQKAAFFVLDPILKALSKKVAVGDDDFVGADVGNTMMHPKQSLFQMANFLNVKTATERDYYVRAQSSEKVWAHGTWRHASLDGDESVSHVSCCGLPLLVVSEPSSTVARNRACAIVSLVLRQNPDLLEKMQAITEKLGLEKGR